MLIAVWALVAVAAGGHALLTASDPRTAWGCIAVCLLFPIAGPILYGVFGINRVRTRGRQLGLSAPAGHAIGSNYAVDVRNREPTLAARILGAHGELVRTSDMVTRLPLLGGNHVVPLHNGEAAFPPMLAAIEAAQHTVALATYLFETNAAGRAFIDALDRARQRGVQVRVLIDGIGEWYTFPRASSLLRRRGVPVARFHPPRLLPPALNLNLRNHRKLLLVDGRIAFTGGMNIGGRHLVSDPNNRKPTTDLHFELRGPVISQLACLFAQDWRFAAGETWMPDLWRADAAPAGQTVARAIADGPNEDLDHLGQVMQAAIASAHQRVRMMTPYFLPPREIEAALQGAALRGVAVDIVLPERGNLGFVHHATRHILKPLIERGMRIWYQPAPFCHSKLFLVDGSYALIGTANCDPRSLRLNFELGVELYNGEVLRAFARHFDDVITRSRQLTAEELDRRRLPRRLRDAACWLFSPYL